MYDWGTAYVSKILHDPVYAGKLIVAERPITPRKDSISGYGGCYALYFGGKWEVKVI